MKINLQTKLDSTNYLQKLERKAKELLEKFQNWQYKWVFFSGGKDSLVALDLANKVWKDFEVIYIEVTGNTHQKCNKYAKRIVENNYGLPFTHLKREDLDFYDCLVRWGYPSVLWRGSRWCLRQFKEKVARRYTKYRGVSVSGISPSDSPRRASRAKPIWFSGWTPVNIYPLFWFRKQDVWLYIHENGLEINPLYKEIGRSGNCMFCPAMRKCEFEQFVKTEFFLKWKKAHEKLRERYDFGRKGMVVLFKKFDKMYAEYVEGGCMLDG